MCGEGVLNRKRGANGYARCERPFCLGKNLFDIERKKSLDWIMKNGFTSNKLLKTTTTTTTTTTTR